MRYLVFAFFLASCGGAAKPPADALAPDTKYIPPPIHDIFPYPPQKPYCGDGYCNGGETMGSCWRDCEPKQRNDDTPEFIPLPPIPPPPPPIGV